MYYVFPAIFMCLFPLFVNTMGEGDFIKSFGPVDRGVQKSVVPALQSLTQGQELRRPITLKCCGKNVFGVDGVTTALILWENEATGSRKVFRCLLDLWDAIFQSKMARRIQKSINQISPAVFSIL